MKNILLLNELNFFEEVLTPILYNEPNTKEIRDSSKLAIEALLNLNGQRGRHITYANEERYHSFNVKSVIFDSEKNINDDREFCVDIVFETPVDDLGETTVELECFFKVNNQTKKFEFSFEQESMFKPKEIKVPQLINDEIKFFLNVLKSKLCYKIFEEHELNDLSKLVKNYFNFCQDDLKIINIGDDSESKVEIFLGNVVSSIKADNLQVAFKFLTTEGHFDFVCEATLEVNEDGFYCWNYENKTALKK